MKFYSYEYLLSKIEQTNIIQIIVAGILIAILCIALFKYYKDKQDSKYRELAIIAVFGVLLLIGIEVSTYQNTAVSTNQYKSSVNFIEKVAEHLNIDKNKIYINSEASIEGAFVKIDDDYYRVVNGGKDEEYLLEKITLIDPKVEKVEVVK